MRSVDAPVPDVQLSGSVRRCGRGEVRPPGADAELRRLQATVGNAAVGHLLKARRSPARVRVRNGNAGPVLQRDTKDKPGWSDADPAIDPDAGFSWNVDEHDVGHVRRFPIQGLSEGLQSDVNTGASAKLTKESAKGRAIALVPKGLVETAPVTILVHLHGYAETTKRPYAGWRQHRTRHKVRDVEHDRIAQQIQETHDPQIIGLLPQGGEQSEFSKASVHPYDTFAADEYISKALEKLVKVGALKSVPTKRTVIVSAHSGGGHTIRSMLKAQEQARIGASTKGLSTPPTGLAGVALFDAMTWDELKDVKAWISGKLEGLRKVLSDPGTSAAVKDKALADTPRFRGYYSAGGSYVDKYQKLDEMIRNWFIAHGDELGPYADKVWALFQVVPVSGLGKPGERHEALVRGSALGDKTAPWAGTLTKALTVIKSPTAETPRPMPPPKTPPPKKKKVTTRR